MPPDAAFLAELFGLEGRTALITGASGGIGRAIATAYARAGARVGLSGRSHERLAATADEISRLGGRAELFPGPLDDLAAIDRLVAEIDQRLGGVDVLVNCAGTNRRQPIVEVDEQSYDHLMQVNLKGAYFLSRALAPRMRERGGGKIVHVGSINAAIGLHSVSVYGLSKAGLVQTTRVMAIEWAEWNIQVNCLCPGFIETELTGPLWRDERRRGWILDRLSIKRPGRPADLVGMALYLAGPASTYTTGQAFYVDGGFLAGSPW